MIEIRGCPFCGKEPVTFFRSPGTVRGYQALSVHIKCETCGIEMRRDAEYNPETGMTSFKSVENAMNAISWEWNHREVLGKQFTAEEVATILAITGQNDTKKFKWGNIIQYSPSEVKKILTNWKEGEEP